MAKSEPPSALTETATGTIALDLDRQKADDTAVTIDRKSVLPSLLEDPVRTEFANERYRVQSEIAHGGMGRVFLAEDRDVNRQVAVKVMRGAASSTRKRFVEEVQLAGQLLHPNIVPVFDVGVTADGAGWYAMRFVDGSTLGDVIDKLRAGDQLTRALFTPARRVKLFLDVLDAVAYAHARHIVHRDLKPANILVGRYGETFVGDWGIADRLDAEKRDVEGRLLGTIHYMSPEQARGDLAHVDERSDIYSLCAILYELLSLEHYLWPLPRDAPREELIEAVLHKKPILAVSVKSPSQKLRVPMDFSRLLDRGLAKDPAERFQSIAELRAAIEAIEDYRPRVQCPSTAALWGLGGMRRLMSRAPVLGWLAVAGVFGLACLGAFDVVIELASRLSR